MVTAKNIETFFESRCKAVVGVSRSKKKFGRMVFDELKKKNYNVLPVNPGAAEIDGLPCYNTIEALPPEVDAAIVLTKRQETKEVVEKLLAKGIKNIWIQQECDTPEALALAASQDVNLIHGKCVFMFAAPVTGMHKFHRNLAKFFGRLPK